MQLMQVRCLIRARSNKKKSKISPMAQLFLRSVPSEPRRCTLCCSQAASLRRRTSLGLQTQRLSCQSGGDHGLALVWSLARFQLAVGNIMRQQMDIVLQALLLSSDCMRAWWSIEQRQDVEIGEDGLKTRERSKEERQKEREEKRKAKVPSPVLAMLPNRFTRADCSNNSCFHFFPRQG